TDADLVSVEPSPDQPVDVVVGLTSRERLDVDRDHDPLGTRSRGRHPAMMPNAGGIRRPTCSAIERMSGDAEHYDAPVATASPLLPHAASHSLMLALELLDDAAAQEAGNWSGAARFSSDVQALATRVRDAKTSSADDECELVRVERLAVETVRMAHTLAGACRDARMAAVIAAVLAESAARIAVEVISEEVPWTPVERLSRQA